MKHACEYIRGLRYKLKMMRIPFSDPCFVYGDNKSVLYNTTLPESALKKKSNSIAYYSVREGVAINEWVTGYEPSDTNVSDLLTKPVPAGKRRTCLVMGVLYYIWLWGFTSWRFPTRILILFCFVTSEAVRIMWTSYHLGILA